jgi:hypothetical protein
MKGPVVELLKQMETELQSKLTGPKLILLILLLKSLLHQFLMTKIGMWYKMSMSSHMKSSKQMKRMIPTNSMMRKQYFTIQIFVSASLMTLRNWMPS